MNWADIAIQILIPIATSGIMLLVIKWIAGVIICRYYFKDRKNKINRTIRKIVKIYSEDATRRGLWLSGYIIAIKNEYQARDKELIKQLKILLWFGKDTESQRIVDEIEIESKSIRNDTDRFYCYHKLYSTIDEIKIILGNSEVLGNSIKKQTEY